MRDSEFKKKISRARRVEREIMKWYRKNVDETARMPAQNVKEYDIICKKVGNVEVKEDRYTHKTGNYAIEVEDASGSPSGIKMTTAEEFVLVDWENVLIMKTDALKYAIRQSKRKYKVKMGYTTLDGERAKGWLVPKEDITGVATVLERWFPVWQE